MARKGFTRSARGKGGPKNNVWTAVLADQVVIAASGLSSFNIVQDSDWTSITGAERCTLLRTRGWLSFHNKTTTGVRVEGAVFLVIQLTDENAGSSDPSVVSSYSDEDTLWTGGGVQTVTDTNATGHVTDLLVDVKAMRKVRKGQDLRLIVANTGAATVEISFVLRALLRKGGN